MICPVCEFNEITDEEEATCLSCYRAWTSPEWAVDFLAEWETVGDDLDELLWRIG